MNIILVRHAKAEQSFSKPDIQRDLNPNGKKDIRKKAQRLTEKLEKENKLYCFSSSANRARQTVEIIIEELEQQSFQIEKIEDLGIYHGDFTLVENELYNFENNDTLLIVGHQPTLSFWAREWSDNYISFSTGDMACFKILSESPLKAEFLWKIE